jgi:multidrug efflux pump subunit AcrB
MLTSYLLSRTLVPAMASYLLPDKHQEDHGTGLWRRFLRTFEAGFERMRQHYVSALSTCIAHRGLSLTCVALMIVGTIPLLFVTGEDFFPTVDAGLMKFHVRAPSGTRIERTELIVDDIERSIRQIIPADELQQISDDIDLPQPYAMAFFPSDNLGPQDGEILIQLKPNHHPTAVYQQRIREMMSTKFPNIEGYFMAADIVNQVLNFPSRRKDGGDSRHHRYADCGAARLPILQG